MTFSDRWLFSAMPYIFLRPLFCEHNQMRTLLFTLIFLGLAEATSAQDFDSGLDAMKRGDFAVALREWQPLAAAGNAAAQFNLGVMYEKGLGVTQEYAKAHKWYRRAANQGNAQAQATTGIMYEIGKGVPQDYVEAYKWASLAAGQGSENAVKTRDIVAAKMTPVQIAEAKRLLDEWTPSATDAEPAAPKKVASLATVRGTQSYLNTLGYDAGSVDGAFGARTEAAIRKFQSAANLPVTGVVTDELVTRLESSIRAKQTEIEKRSKVVSTPPKPAIKPMECDNQAAHPDDKLRPPEVAGVRFEDIDIALAIEACENALVRKPSDLRYQFQFARSLHRAQRYGEAATLYERAGTQGSALAQKSLGFMYAHGLGVVQNYTAAAEWHHKAAEQGDADAQHNLGFLYANGQGVAQDNVQAHLWYSLAAEQGNEDAAKSRDLLVAKMSESQIADANRRTREWLDQNPK